MTVDRRIWHKWIGGRPPSFGLSFNHVGWLIFHFITIGFDGDYVNFMTANDVFAIEKWFYRTIIDSCNWLLGVLYLISDVENETSFNSKSIWITASQLLFQLQKKLLLLNQNVLYGEHLKFPSWCRYLIYFCKKVWTLLRNTSRQVLKTIKRNAVLWPY